MVSCKFYDIFPSSKQFESHFLRLCLNLEDLEVDQRQYSLEEVTFLLKIVSRVYTNEKTKGF